MTRILITIARTTYCPGAPTAATAAGSTRAAAIDASDTIRYIATNIPKAANAKSNARGQRTTQTPSAADTPFPPINPGKTEQIDPTNAARAIQANSVVANPIPAATATGIAPFRISPTKVSAAAPLPPARTTLVIPILPEPTARGSKPRRRPTMTPNGIDPARYDATIMRAKLIIVLCGPAKVNVDRRSPGR